MIAARIDCQSAIKELWDYLDDELPAERTAQIRAHLASCTGCETHVQFCRAFLTHIDMPIVSATQLAALRDKVRVTLEREGLVAS